MSDAQTLSVYADRAADYGALEITADQREALTLFLGGLPAGAAILDLGCGPGLHAAEMQAQGFRVTGLDPTPAFVDAARARGVDARLGGFDDLSGYSGLDAVWASFCLVHVPRADLAGHLTAIARALRPGGRLFLGMKLGSGEGRDELGRFYGYHSEAELHAALAAAGFRVTSSRRGRARGLAGTTDPYVLIQAHG